MTAPLLGLRGVTVNYSRGPRRPTQGRGRRMLADAVTDVSLDIGPGETVALVGESGSGKSTLGNAVLGLVPVTAGTITFAGEDITRATPRRRRELTRLIQPIFQAPYGSLNPVRTVRQTLVEPVLAQPRLIVCDEPTSALDLSVQAQILNLLTRLRRELGVSYLFITHDLAIIRHIADRVAVLYRGRIVETGPTAQVCDEPSDPYTSRLLAAAPVPDPVEQRRRRTLLADQSAGREGVPACRAQ